jgi:prepilin signal peptidase PulO-like enzyme (type II secretory pathway)
MITHLALRRLPQWTALSKAQCQFVWQHCIHPLLTRYPLMVAKTVLILGFLSAASWLGLFGGLVPYTIVMIAVISPVPELLDVWVIARHRQDIEAYIQNHESEIQSIA